jgi:hypothetical protein
MTGEHRWGDAVFINIGLWRGENIPSSGMHTKKGEILCR